MNPNENLLILFKFLLLKFSYVVSLFVCKLNKFKFLNSFRKLNFVKGLVLLRILSRFLSGSTHCESWNFSEIKFHFNHCSIVKCFTFTKWKCQYPFKLVLFSSFGDIFCHFEIKDVAYFLVQITSMMLLFNNKTLKYIFFCSLFKYWMLCSFRSNRVKWFVVYETFWCKYKSTLFIYRLYCITFCIAINLCNN